MEPRGRYVTEDEIIQHPTGTVKSVKRYADLWTADGHLNNNGRDTLYDVSGVHEISSNYYRANPPPTASPPEL